jgi:nucleotidyltransferase substrate binding protein (TIGR01987 family)
MSSGLNLISFEKAVASLGASLQVLDDPIWVQEQSEVVYQTMLSGVVKNFEFVYELSVKMIRRQLETESLDPSEIDHDNFRTILRTAAEKGLIGDVTAWFRYRDLRNRTSHTYDHDKAIVVYEESHAFLEDAKALLAALRARNG